MKKRKGLFNHLKKTQEEGPKEAYRQHLILGKSLSSALLYKKLSKDLDKSKLGVISPSLFFIEDLCLPGPSLLRDQGEADYIKNLWPSLSFKKSSTKSKFYKDQKLHEFGKRTKPQTLFEGENFFVSEPFDFSFNAFFEEGIEEVRKELNSSVLGHEITKISKVVSDDLAEPRNWKVTTSDGTTLYCEYLYSAYPAFKLLKLMDKDFFESESLISFCETTKASTIAIIEFEAEGKIYEQDETFFIPLSQSQENGHYIGEFQAYDEESDKQKFSFSLFIPEEWGEDEVSKKLRALKRNLAKIFPQFGKKTVSEKIIISSDLISPKVSDKDFNHSFFSENNLFLIGTCAPITKEILEKESFTYSEKGLSYLTRALLSVDQVRRLSGDSEVNLSTK